MNPCPVCAQPKIVMEGHHPKKDMLAFRCTCCGEFYLDALAVGAVRGLPMRDRYLISASIRSESDAGRMMEIVGDDLPRLRDAAPRWRSPFEGVDRLLLLMAARTESILGPVHIDQEVDFPMICALGPGEVNELLSLGRALGLIHAHLPAFTTEGLRRVDMLRATQPDSRQAFVAMWFDPDLDAAWREGFEPGIEAAGYFRAVRVDAIEHNEKVDDRIIAELRRSGLVVADFTGQRGGVYFEAGYARGLGTPVIWTCREDWTDRLHFDTRQYNHIVWKEPADLRQQLADRIAATVLPRGWTGARP